MTASHTDSTPRTACHSLQVATVLYEFIEQKVLPDIGVGSSHQKSSKTKKLKTEVRYRLW